MIEPLRPSPALPSERGDIAVCLLAGGRPEAAADARKRLLAYTPEKVPVLLARDAEPAAALAQAAAASKDADLVIVGPEVLVASGWLERLRDAAASDTITATASSPAHDDGTAGELDCRAAALAEESPSPRARVLAPDCRCLYIRRAALDLAGPFDGHLNSLGGVLADFAERCLQYGLQHVMASDTVVSGGALETSATDAELLLRRYEWRAQEQAAEAPSVSRAVSAVDRASRGLSLTIDATILGPVLSGTHMHVLELTAAVARTGRARVRVVVSPELGGEAREQIDGLESVERLLVADVSEETPRSDVAHRPNQLFGLHDLDLLRRLGRRIVVTQQDLIAYRNPAYQPTPELWTQYRRVTRLGLAMADAAVFSSEHARRDALADDLIDTARAHVLAIGTEHRIASFAGEPRRPQSLDAAPPDGFLLCAGTDYLHKNRLFAIRLLEQLRAAHGWNGGLVLAGPSILHGSSRADEDSYLAERPDLAGHVERLGPVEQAEIAWLFENARALVYPSVYEGFGLVPFEAAHAGTPCLWAPQASLADLLPVEEAALVPWDATASAERALPLLRDRVARERHVAAVRRAEDRLPGWDEHADALIEVYERVVREPYREASAVAAEALEREAELAGWNELKAELGEEGFGLVGPGGYLPPDVQRALVSVVTRPGLRDALFAGLRGVYRAGYRMRRR